MGLEAAAAIGLAGNLVGTGMSFHEAAKAKKAMKKADYAADIAMQKARKRLGVNYAEQLSLNKEPYENLSESSKQAGAQLMAAAGEDQRGAGRVGGLILANQLKTQQAINDKYNRDLFNLNAGIVEEESRLRDINTELDMGEVAGAQERAREMEMRKNNSITQGFQGAINSAGLAYENMPLYSKWLANRRAKQANAGGVQEDAIVNNAPIINPEIDKLTGDTSLGLPIDSSSQNIYGQWNRPSFNYDWTRYTGS